MTVSFWAVIMFLKVVGMGTVSRLQMSIAALIAAAAKAQPQQPAGSSASGAGAAKRPSVGNVPAAGAPKEDAVSANARKLRRSRVKILGGVAVAVVLVLPRTSPVCSGVPCPVSRVLRSRL